MPAYPRSFLTVPNFELAFTRLARGANKEYKAYYRHLLPSYELGKRENLEDLIADLRTGRYVASHGCVIHQPKRSGILRPLTLLSLRDLIVFQAIMNCIAARFDSDQARFALTRSFGAILAGPTSPYFYRSWRVCYRKYNDALARAYKAGNPFVADFDLVSFYELIDHNLLRKCLSKRVENRDLLDLLFHCLAEWTVDRAGEHLRHGVPQGPEPSAFLAECFLLHLDHLKFKNIHYFRYVDDIKLLAHDEVPLRRALLRLDLRSKDLGLVPQAEKIECRRVPTLSQLLKSVPSALASQSPEVLEKTVPQRQLIRLFRRSLAGRGKTAHIKDITAFKFALRRLRPRRDVIRRLAPLLVRRPDCSWVMSHYFRKFPRDRQAADILLSALRCDPTYDAAAANYIDAMDACEPSTEIAPYRRVIQTANQRSEEQSLVLRVASAVFRAKRRSASKAANLLRRETDARALGLMIHKVFGDAPDAPFRTTQCLDILQDAVVSPNDDLARFAASHLLTCLPPDAGKWQPPRTANRSVTLLLLSLGLRRRAPRRTGVLDVFFHEKMRIAIKVPWRRALGADLRDAEGRCLRLQRLRVGDQSAWVLMLDTFNEVLLYAFARRHPTQCAQFKKLRGTKHHPDFGVWLHDPVFCAALPTHSSWWKGVHATRVRADLAHAKEKKSGQRTRPVSFRQADRLWSGAQAAWAELLRAWTRLL